MKKENNKPANTTTANNNTEKKVLPIGKTMTAADIEALQARLAAAEAALAEEKAAKAALEAKVKTSAKREPKAPDTYDILQPLFVALRGSINKGITSDENIIAIFQYAVHALKINLSADIQRRLFEKTVQHNSVSNIAKAETLASAEGRKAAYIEMTEQARIMLPKITEKEWSEYKAAYDTAYNKAVAKLKK